MARARNSDTASANNPIVHVSRKLFKNIWFKPSWFFSYDWLASIQGRACFNSCCATREDSGTEPRRISCSAGA